MPRKIIIILLIALAIAVVYFVYWNLTRNISNEDIQPNSQTEPNYQFTPPIGGMDKG